MFIALENPTCSGAVRRGGTQVDKYPPGSFRPSERRLAFGKYSLSINISLLRSEGITLRDSLAQLVLRSPPRASHLLKERETLRDAPNER